MNYQELVNECKRHYVNNDMKNAYKLWCDIHDLLESKLNAFDKYDEANRYKCYQEFHDYMQQFSDDEVYKITDYGKQKEYRQMELERTYSVLNKSVKLYDLTKDSKMKSLDEFLSFYEWCIIESDDDKNKYEIYDLQTNRVIDDESKTLNDIISRVIGRAVDYETNECECDDEYIDEDILKYYEDLYDIARRYNNGLWLNYFREFIDDFTLNIENKMICLVCGGKKEDLQSAYCDKCWEDEKQRLGIEE